MAKRTGKSEKSKGAKRKESPWAAPAFRRERFAALMMQVPQWEIWADNLGSAVRDPDLVRRIRRVARILKATMLAFHWQDDEALKRAGLAALRYLDE